jgi:uncharacterized protein (DUF2141 family)
MLRINKLCLSFVFVVALVGFVFPLAQEGAICSDQLDTWTERTSGTTNALDGVTYGNGTFVAVGESGTILTSSNGVTWSTRTSGTTNHLEGVTYGDGTFIAVGGSETILTSTDGVTWNTETLWVTSNHLYGVTYGNGTFVAVGGNGTILTSLDGVTWSTRTSGTTQGLHGVTYGNGIFVAVGWYGTILTSTDGVTWTERASEYLYILDGVAYCDGTFIAVGTSGTILTSPDGVAWNTRTSGTSSDLVGVTYGDGTFVAVTSGTRTTLTPGYLNISRGEKILLTSADGITWTKRNFYSLDGVTYGNSTFVAVGGSGLILQSDPLIVQYTLTVTKTGTGSGTVTSNPAGINCGADCSEEYDEGTSVTLTPTPGSGSTFTGWSGACSGAGACTVSMTSDKTVTATFTQQQQPQYTLTVTKSGTGSGTVTSNPAGINCGSDCSEEYDEGTSVTLTPAPGSGSTFTGWSGACSGAGACTVSMTSDKTVTATFTQQQQQQYTLTVLKLGTGGGTVTSSPAGINCGSDCSETYSKVQKVKLTAKADANSTFTGWSGGGCSGTKTCTVMVDTAVTVTADFALKIPDISVAQTSVDFSSVKLGKKATKTLKIMNNGTGDLSLTLSGLEGTDFSIQGSSSVTIKAKKSYSLKVLFTPKSAGLQTATVTITSNDPDTPELNIALSGSTVEQPQQYTLTVTKAGTGSGSVTSNPAGITCGADCSEVYNQGTSVTLTATPDSGSTFTGWSGVCSGTGACTVSMTSDKTVTATFTQQQQEQYTLTVTKAGTGSGTVTSNPAGINCGADCSETYNQGTSVTLTATPDSGFTFTGWSGVCSGTGACIVNMTSDKAATATFAQQQYTLTVTKSGTGSGTVTSIPTGINCGADCSEAYNQGTSVILTATPDSGSTFTGWSGACSGVGTCTLNMTSDKAATAAFAQQQYTLTVTKAGTGSGTVVSIPTGINCGADCSEVYNQGTSVTLTATPALGSTFEGWSGDGDCSDGVVTMNANKTCTATFNIEVVEYTLTVTKAGTGSGTVTSNPAGINCGAGCSEEYNQGTSVTLTATPDSGSAFTGWSGACSGIGACIVSMTSDKTATATFTVSYSGTWNGTTSQGKEFILTVTINGITDVKYGISCGGTQISSTTHYGSPVQIIGNTFSLASSAGLWDGITIQMHPVTIHGTFNSPTSASGTIAISGSLCNASATWSATK